MENFNLDIGQVMNIASTFMGQSEQTSKEGASSSMLDNIIRMIAGFLGVDSGVISKYYNGFAALALANDWNQVTNILHELTGANVDEMAAILENVDFREQLAGTMSDKFFTWIQDFLEPSSLRMKLFFVNGFLMQNNLPPIDSENLIKSSSALLDKAAKDYLGYSSIGSETYMRNIENQVKVLMHLDKDEALDFQNFTKTDLVGTGKSVALKEVVEPFAQALTNFKTAVENPHCAEMIFCYANMPAVVKTPLGLKGAVTRACSTFAVWGLSRVSKPGMPPFSRLYQAAWDGASGEDCLMKYPSKKCDKLLSGPKLLMSPDYERTEL